jgi:hypothetical protein
MSSNYSITRPPTQRLDVDLVLPDELLGPGRENTDVEKVSHLLDTGEEDVSGHEESDTFGAWG